MKKSKVKVDNPDKKIVQGVTKSPLKFFSNLKKLAVSLPTWSKHILLSFKENCLEIYFFEDTQDFFVFYAKKAIQQSNLKFISFVLEDKWKLFIPPTLIGTNLKTKVRK